jgi:hypothetical protein
MKISNDTLTILKWLSTINSGIKIDVGNKLFSKFEANSMVAMVEVEEVFPQQFITANLSKFLAIVDLFEEPDFEFTDDHVKISSSNGKNKVLFYQSRPELVTQPNKVPTKIPAEPAISFHLSTDNLKKLFKACTVMGVSDIKLTAKNGLITMSIMNKSVKTGDTFDVMIGECDETLDLTYFYKKQNLKLISDYSYDVDVYPVGLTKFSGKDTPYKTLDVWSVTTVVED